MIVLSTLTGIFCPVIFPLYMKIFKLCASAMDAIKRLTIWQLTLLRTLILWSLSSSDIVKGIITNNYKQNRHDDDLNQPLSVQPWGSDSYRRRYYLIEGLDDTNFRIYRESGHIGVKRTWWSVAGDIEELKALAEKLSKVDGGQKARVLSEKMMQAIPRFEATEEVSIRFLGHLRNTSTLSHKKPGYGRPC